MLPLGEPHNGRLSGYRPDIGKRRLFNFTTPSRLEQATMGSRSHTSHALYHRSRRDHGDVFGVDSGIRQVA